MLPFLVSEYGDHDQLTLPGGSGDWVWREDVIIELLANHKRGSLFVAGCK